MLSFALYAVLAQDGLQYRDPMSKEQELLKFHKPDVKAMPMSVRLAAYEKRKQMLASSEYKNIQYRQVGPSVQGGRVIDIESPIDRPKDLYIAYATGGLWHTDNEGQTWTPLFDDQSAFGIGDIALSDDGKTIWLGSGEANSQRTSYSGTGVFKSTDSGKTWTNMGLHESHHIGRVVIHPRRPDTVYVASLGPLYSQGGDRGLFRTTDGGKTWTNILPGNERTGCIDVAIDSKNPDVMYASMYDRDRRAWNFLEAGAGSAVYKTTDAGKTWTKLRGVPTGVEMGRTAIGLSPSNPNRVYLFVDNQANDDETGLHDRSVPGGRLTLHRFLRMPSELRTEVDEEALTVMLRPLLPQGTDPAETAKKFKAKELSEDDLQKLILQRNPTALDKDTNLAEVWRSDDAGRTWTKTRADMGDHGGYYWNECIVHPTNPDEVYTLGLELLKSTDGGASWTAIAQRNHVDHHAFWIDPHNPSRMVDGNDGGVYVSYNAGASWTHWNNMAVGQFTTIAVDNKQPYNIYGGLQDNGTMVGPSNYRHGISDINQWKAIGGGDGSAIAVDPRNGGDLVYTASQFGAHSALNQATGQRWSARPRAAQGEELRFNWISPVLISPHHPDVVYIGSQKLHRSFDQGRNYTALSDDLTKNRENGDVPHSTLTTIAESPFRFGQIWIGCDDGTVKFTPDSGLTWQAIPTPQPDRWVTRIVASKHKEGRVYCSQNGYRQNEWSAYVWVSEDFGKTWRSIAANLPAEAVNTVREDPTMENVLYVGTDMGVYVSTDRGGSWQTYGSGIPNTPVHDVAIQERDKELVVASHARSVFAISIKPIHDLTEEIRGKEFHAFTLDVPSNRDSWGFERVQPYADPDAQDRLVTSFFWTTLSGNGKLELKDSEGKVVVSKDVTIDKGYNTETLSLMLDPGKPRAPRDDKDSTTVDEALRDRFAARRPTYVAAGSYKLVLTVGGKTFEQDVAVR